MAMKPGDGAPSIAQEFRRGWRALLGSIIGLAFGGLILLHTAGVFVQTLQDQFGWTRSQLSAVSLITTVAVIPFSPVVGMMIDRWGVMLPSVAGMLGLAAGFGAMGLMTGNFAEYVLLYVATGLFGLMASHIGLTRAITGAFDRARGLALAIVMAASGGIAALMPMVLVNIMSAEGWRIALFKLGAAIFIATPVVAVLLGSQRRQITPVSPSPIFHDPPRRPSMGTLLKDPLLLRLCAAFFFMAVGLTGYTFHLIPMLVDRGMPATEAAQIQALFGIAIILGALVIGPLFDHFFAPYVAAATLAVTIACIAAFAVAGSVLAPLFVMAMGLSMGAQSDLMGFLTSRYFGMEHYGSYFGILFASSIMANGCSALLISLIADGFGGYQASLWVSAALPILSIILLVTAPRFERL